jgi:regulator of replication initiation timing
MEITIDEIKLALADAIIERDAWRREAEKLKHQLDQQSQANTDNENDNG